MRTSDLPIQEIDVRTITTRGGPIAALFTIILTAAACGGAPAAPASSSPDVAPAGLTTRFEGVTLDDGATVLDAATGARDLRSVDDDGALNFASGSAAKAAKPGEILVVERNLIRKVVDVRESGDEVLVTTAEATLGEFIKDGEIGWDYKIDWNDLPAATYESAAAGAGLDDLRVASTSNRPPAGLPRTTIAGKELKFAGDVKGFAVELKFVPKADKLEFDLNASRSNVKVSAKGFITQFQHEAEINFTDGAADLLDTTVTGLKGDAELTWAAFQVNDPTFDDDITAFELPLNLPIPFAVGPVPMTLNVKMNIRVVPALTAGQASSGGSFKVNYDSQHGFSTNGGSVNPLAKVASFAADLGAKDTVTAGFGPVGFGFGLEWPRLELALGHPVTAKLMQPYVFLTMNTYVNGQWTPGTTLTADIPPCQRASIKLSAIAGYKLSVLGMAEISDNTLLWEKTIDKYKDNRACTLTGEAP